MITAKLAILVPVLLFIAACATTPQWNAANGNRELGVVKVSYEHEKSSEPLMSVAQADQIARSRCATWGYTQAEMIPGELRACSLQEGNSCELWKVTREYQCKGGAYPQSAAR